MNPEHILKMMQEYPNLKQYMLYDTMLVEDEGLSIEEFLEKFFSDKYSQECVDKEDYDELYEQFNKLLQSNNLPKEYIVWLTKVLLEAKIDFIPKLTTMYEGMFIGMKLTEAQCEQVAQLKASLTEAEEMTYPW